MGHSHSAQWIDGSAKLGHRPEHRAARLRRSLARTSLRASSIIIIIKALPRCDKIINIYYKYGTYMMQNYPWFKYVAEEIL